MNRDTTHLQKPLRWILALAALGLINSIILLFFHLGAGPLTGLCSISSGISCDVLQLHQYSEWWGVPIPIFSIYFYIVVLLVALRATRTSAEQVARPAAYLWMMSWAAVASTIYMAAISLFILKTLCPFCFGLYVISLGLFWACRSLVHKIGQPWGVLVKYDLGHATTSKWAWGLLLSMLLMIGGGHFLFRDKGQLTGDAHVISSEATRTLGDASAPVIINVFSDFECPWCRVAAGIMAQLEQDLKGKIRVTYKFFPLDRSCNRMGGMHHTSCAAARASYCAGQQKKFWIYHDLLFGSQGNLSQIKFIQLGRDAGLDMNQFSACLSSDAAKSAISTDIEEGIQLQIQGTPSIFIAGQLYSGPPDLAGIKSVIQQRLSK